MTMALTIHPENPQLRLLRRSIEVLEQGGIIVYPTDSAYALGCSLGNKEAMDRIRRLRELDKHHNFTLVCRDLSEISTYAHVDNSVYRLLKAHTPGPYTFILRATNEVPRRLQHPKRKTIGLRVPDNSIVLGLLEELGEPLMSSTLIMPNEDMPLANLEEIHDKLDGKVDLIIDGGPCSMEPTSVIDLVDGTPEVKRFGRGDVSVFQ